MEASGSIKITILLLLVVVCKDKMKLQKKTADMSIICPMFLSTGISDQNKHSHFGTG